MIPVNTKHRIYNKDLIYLLWGIIGKKNSKEVYRVAYKEFKENPNARIKMWSFSLDVNISNSISNLTHIIPPPPPKDRILPENGKGLIKSNNDK